MELYFGNTRESILISENAIVSVKQANGSKSLQPSPMDIGYKFYTTLIFNNTNQQAYYLAVVNPYTVYFNIPLIDLGNYTYYVFDSSKTNSTIKLDTLKQKMGKELRKNFKTYLKRSDLGRIIFLRHFTVMPIGVSVELKETLKSIPGDVLQYIIINLDIIDILDLCVPGTDLDKRICQNPYFYQLLAKTRLTEDPEYLAKLDKYKLVDDLIHAEYTLNSKYPSLNKRDYKFEKILKKFHLVNRNDNLLEGLLDIIVRHDTIFNRRFTPKEIKLLNNVLYALDVKYTINPNENIAKEQLNIWNAVLSQTSDQYFNVLFNDYIRNPVDDRREIFLLMLSHIEENERNAYLTRFDALINDYNPTLARSPVII
jgi:hypothetical protein